MRTLASLFVLLSLACGGFLNKTQDPAPSPSAPSPGETPAVEAPPVQDPGCMAVIPGVETPTEAAAMSTLFGSYDEASRRSSFTCGEGESCSAEPLKLITQELGGRRWVVFTALTFVDGGGPAGTRGVARRAMLAAVAGQSGWCVERWTQPDDLNPFIEAEGRSPELMLTGNGRAVLRWDEREQGPMDDVGHPVLSLLALDREAAAGELLRVDLPYEYPDCMTSERRLRWAGGDLELETWESRGGPPTLVATQRYLYSGGESEGQGWSLVAQPEQRRESEAAALTEGIHASLHAEVLPFDLSVSSPPQGEPVGPVVGGLRWRDGAGERQLVAVMQTQFPEPDEGDPRPTYLLMVRLWSNPGSGWVEDWREEVTAHGSTLGLESLHVTELDGDGVPEAWILTSGVSLEVDSPGYLDVYLREGQERLTWSGWRLDQDRGWSGSGSYQADEAATSAPESFKGYVSRLWLERCAPVTR